ncbi:TetR family transcriptional regulator [Rhizobium laguerreae]|uniref:TetR family transcriptional regulator n=1 Tax=Rhizobium laguerreae TaxID=1076926 RepID=A0AB35FDC5_9HYPH|nr:TetR family transcriptional regulator [Rhizobium laguerreae]MBY3064756.1 TetR family transcriptional regulator [Rhizobium laguerreae]MBY3308146.1 TetR family transcriptional regulator [Rhizobium laguerreae]
MRFEKGHKENTRRRIVDVASKRFRADGAAASGLAGIMTEAGLTNGAFYAHFDSKEALVKEAMVIALAHQRENLEQDRNEEQDFESVIRNYLNVDHMLGRETGCPSAALLPEIGRQPEATRDAYEVELGKFTNALASMLPPSPSSSSKERAIAIFGLMVGTLQIARAVSSPTTASSILEGGVQAALMLATS